VLNEKDVLYKISFLFIYYLYTEANIAIKIKRRYQGRVRDQHIDYINESIRAKELLVINHDGTKLGVMSKSDALNKADEAELDLVLISDKGEIAVAKIIDYGKFKFERKKKESEIKKNQKNAEMKEIRLRPNIGQHDLDVKIRAAEGFIKKGHRVKISLSFRGREMANKEVGFETMKKFLDSISELAQIDKPAKLNGRFLDAYISSTKK